MAIFRVDSTATGLGTGLNWTDAFTTLAGAIASLSASGGDIVYVDDGHVEDSTVALSHAFPTADVMTQILCVDKADDSWSTGAQIKTSGNGDDITFDGNIYVRGLFVEGNRECRMGTLDGTDYQIWEDCTIQGEATSISGDVKFRLGKDTGPYGQRFRFINCDIDFSLRSDANDCIELRGNCRTIQIGGSLKVYTSATQMFLDPDIGGSVWECLGVDVDGPSTIHVSTTRNSHLIFRHCTVPASWLSSPTVPDTIGTTLELINCASGTITEPVNRWLSSEIPGTCDVDITRYRQGGSNDNEQPDDVGWCFDLTTTSGVQDHAQFIETPWLRFWVTDASTSVKFHIAGAAALNDSECWVELLTPSEEASAVAIPFFQMSKDKTGTPTQILNDSASTWLGTGLDVRQEIEFTIDPTIAGMGMARVCFAKASSTVYVDGKAIVG